MKKILVLFLVLFLPLAAFAQEPLSQEVLDQAKLQAGLFLELKNALGLAWMDDYNAYLEDPANSPQPAWATSVQVLINDSYLSETFPTDFVITPTGQEVTISRTITSQAIKDVLPIYLPSVAIVGDTVSLLVQRPEQWVAWEAGLLGKVSRDGSDDPDILPNSVLDFGEGSEIRFANNDGKISGVESLVYKAQELDDRFVNTSGDNMTGDLKINGYKVLHTGDYGHGNGINADLLDGQHGSYYLAAENLTGIVPPERLKGQTYDINISGRASVATKADHATDSDTLDSHPASDFATAGHSHSEYLNKTKPEGDTMIGPLGVNFENGISSGIGSHSIRGAGPVDVVGKGFKIDWDTDFGFVGLVDKGADRKDMVFANEQTGDNFVFMSQGMEIMTLKPESKTLEIDGNKVWHAGNDGSGSGLDADKLDGKHASDFLSQPIRIPAGQDLNNYTTPGMYYCPLNVDAQQIANTPVNLAFSLLVEQHAGVKQTFTQYYSDDPKTWVRNLYAGVWGPWKEMGMGSGGGWDVILEARTTGSGGAGYWATWPLNAVAYNNGVLISLSSNQFTLPPGTYCIEWDTTAFRINEGTTRLYNATFGTVVAYGSNYYSNAGANYATVLSFGTAITTITRNSAFIIQYYHNRNATGLSLGVPGPGFSMFGQVRIKKME